MKTIKRLALILALLPGIARAAQCTSGEFVTNPSCTLPANTMGTKSFAQACKNADPTKCLTAANVNELNARIDALRTALVDTRAYVLGMISPPGHTWTTSVSPSVISSPTVVTLSEANLTTKNLGACSGSMYWVSLNDSTDYVVKSAQVLTHPVFIQGGRNVRIVGLEIDLTTATPCGGSGVQIPGTFGLRVDNVGATYIEGLYLDAAGFVADAIAIHNTTGGGIDYYNPITSGTESAARGIHDIVLQNSVIRGYFAYGGSDEHADTMQPQGAHEIFRNVTFENVSVDSGCEGAIFLARDGFAAASQITIRNWDYRLDTRFNWNSSQSRFSTAYCGGGTSYYGGGPLMLNAKAFSYSNVYLSTDVVRQYSNASSCGAGCVQPCDGSTGIFCPALPTARYASPGASEVSNAWTGRNYVSPWAVP